MNLGRWLRGLLSPPPPPLPEPEPEPPSTLRQELLEKQRRIAEKLHEYDRDYYQGRIRIIRHEDRPA